MGLYVPLAISSRRVEFKNCITPMRNSLRRSRYRLLGVARSCGKCTPNPDECTLNLYLAFSNTAVQMFAPGPVSTKRSSNHGVFSVASSTQGSDSELTGGAPFSIFTCICPSLGDVDIHWFTFTDHTRFSASSGATKGTSMPLEMKSLAARLPARAWLRDMPRTIRRAWPCVVTSRIGITNAVFFFAAITSLLYTSGSLYPKPPCGPSPGPSRYGLTTTSTFTCRFSSVATKLRALFRSAFVGYAPGTSGLLMNCPRNTRSSEHTAVFSMYT